MHNGDLKYLQQQKSYLTGLIDHYLQKIDKNNSEDLNDGARFLDWPSSNDPKAIHAGLQAMMIITLRASSELFHTLKDEGNGR